MIAAKVCRMCGVGKVLEEFSLKNTNKDGRETACKECLNALRRQRGTTKNRIDPTIRIHRRVRNILREDAQRFGVSQGRLASYALAAGLRAMREGKLPVPSK